MTTVHPITISHTESAGLKVAVGDACLPGRTTLSIAVREGEFHVNAQVIQNVTPEEGLVLQLDDVPAQVSIIRRIPNARDTGPMYSDRLDFSTEAVVRAVLSACIEDGVLVVRTSPSGIPLPSFHDISITIDDKRGSNFQDPVLDRRSVSMRLSCFVDTSLEVATLLGHILENNNQRLQKEEDAQTPF